MRTFTLFGLAAGLSLAACAANPPAPSPAPEVAAAEPAPDASKNFFKIGARVFPRCQSNSTLGSRVNDYTYCLTEEQVARLDDTAQQMKVEMDSRSGILPINIGGN